MTIEYISFEGNKVKEPYDGCIAKTVSIGDGHKVDKISVTLTRTKEIKELEPSRLMIFDSLDKRLLWAKTFFPENIDEYPKATNFVVDVEDIPDCPALILVAWVGVWSGDISCYHLAASDDGDQKCQMYTYIARTGEEEATWQPLQNFRGSINNIGLDVLVVSTEVETIEDGLEEKSEPEKIRINSDDYKRGHDVGYATGLYDAIAAIENILESLWKLKK